jgi:hypothetical protein
MRDTVVGIASTKASNSSPPVIRAMANTLHDTATDPFDQTAVITRLLCAGWLSRDINKYLAPVITMVIIRKQNEESRKYAFTNR